MYWHTQTITWIILCKSLEWIFELRVLNAYTESKNWRVRTWTARIIISYSGFNTSYLMKWLCAIWSKFLKRSVRVYTRQITQIKMFKINATNDLSWREKNPFYLGYIYIYNINIFILLKSLRDYQNEIKIYAGTI